MPTVPSAQAPQPDPAPHRHRQVAESFGVDPTRYDRTRPRYPDAMVARIAAAAPGPLVLDVGCGTGIAARQFQAAGCTVLGIEPDARMAAFARRSSPATAVEVATFETWDPAGRAFDAVVAGQAWHWVDPVAGAARAAQALRPGGLLAVFWNVFQPPPEVADAFAEVQRQAMPDAPPGIWTTPMLDTYAPMFTMAADGLRRSGAFAGPDQGRFDWDRTYTRDEWLDQMPTHGGSSRLPPATLDALLAGTGAAIDALGGSFSMHYTTVAVTAVRSDPGGS